MTPLSAATRSVMDELEELRRERDARIAQMFYTAAARNERAASRIIDGPASELIPPGRGRSRTRGMRP